MRDLTVFIGAMKYSHREEQAAPMRKHDVVIFTYKDWSRLRHDKMIKPIILYGMYLLHYSVALMGV